MIDPRQISINSIDRLDRLTDFILDSLYLPRFLADRSDGHAYATEVLCPSVAVCRRRRQ